MKEKIYTVTWFRYPHGIEGECMDCKSREFDSLEKAIAFLHRRCEIIMSINWAGGYVEDERGREIYTIFDDGSVEDNTADIVETTEVCPNCEEEVTLDWDLKDGYKTTCPNCSGRLMLCDLCQHRDGITDETGKIVGQSDCNYDTKTDSCRFSSAGVLPLESI